MSTGLLPISDSNSDSFKWRCNRVEYGTQISEGILWMRASPGFPDVEQQEIQIPLCHVLSASVVIQEQEPRRGYLNLISFRCSIPPADPEFSPRVYINLAYRVRATRWRTRDVVLQADNLQQCEQLCSQINDYVSRILTRPKRLMFFLNPISGNGCAVKIFNKNLVPLLQASGVQYEFITSTHAGHAKEWILEQWELIQNFDGLVAVGGDGIFNEVMEGVIRLAQVGHLDVTTDLKSPNMRIGIIPAGSTDSIGCCIGLGDPKTALLQIILGFSMMLDVGVVFREDGSLIKFFCGFLGYGFFSDTLKNSEKRWLRHYLGKSRYMLAGAKTFLMNHAYSGSLSYKPADDEILEGYPDEGPACIKDCRKCNEVGASKLNLTESFSSIFEAIDWKTIHGTFTNLIVVSLCCRSTKSPKGLLPASHCGDGCLDLLIVKSIGRLRLLNYLIGTTRGIGPKQSLGNCLHACRVYELRFRTKKGEASSNPGKGATVWNCDGEIIQESDIHVRVSCQLIDVYGVGFEPS